ncbi:hypothetical protein DYB34_002237 [Aphanomyces astaci]|uniref:Uncharacterized protein n=2 Tax=Aphanomyces astaci TaxID=112090 RepID=A0A397AYI3_APHAT|nr:hypothetical protein DYB36_001354 [Aphanomyces astaci]RHY54873.1 hypothetical protein DYB34_002237 [Aphanomyces astaci]
MARSLVAQFALNRQSLRASSTKPWYRDEISSILSPADGESVASVEELRQLMAVPRGRGVVASEIQAQGRSPSVGGYETLSQKKKQDRIWTQLQRVLTNVEQDALPTAVADAYTVAFQALSRANMPYESMEALLRHMQSQQIPVSIQIHISMLAQAKGSALVQVLRKVKASRAAASLLGDACRQPPLLPTDIQSLHYHAYDAIIRTIHSRYMESTTSVFALTNYQDLYAAMVEALPPLDIKLLERTISAERMDKLAVASVRAPAMCGLGDVVLDRLDTLQEEYVGRSADVPLQVFEAAIEAFSALVHGLIHVPESTLAVVREVGLTSSVLSSPRLKALRRLERSVGVPLNNLMQKIEKDADKDDSDVAKDAATFDMYKASVFLRFISKRMAGARTTQSHAVVAHEAMVAADGLMQDIEDAYVASRRRGSTSTTTSSLLVPLHVAKLKQYFVAASRLDRRVPVSGPFQDELVYRVFQLVDVLEGLHYAFRTLVVLFRVSEATMVLDLKETLFPNEPRRVDEYDDLIMAVVSNDRTRFDQPLQLLQRMHNQGVTPTPLTMHRLVLFQLNLLNNATPSTRKQLMADVKYNHMRRRLPEWNVDVPTPEFHPLQFYKAKAPDSTSVGDIVSFVVDWHNMTGVVPFGKTLKLLVEHCRRHQQDKTDVHELHRLLQWAHSLPLDPATQVYLEHVTTSVVPAVADDATKEL